MVDRKDSSQSDAGNYKPCSPRGWSGLAGKLAGTGWTCTNDHCLARKLKAQSAAELQFPNWSGCLESNQVCQQWVPFGPSCRCAAITLRPEIDLIPRRALVNAFFGTWEEKSRCRNRTGSTRHSVGYASLHHTAKMKGGGGRIALPCSGQLLRSQLFRCKMKPGHLRKPLKPQAARPLMNKRFTASQHHANGH